MKKHQLLFALLSGVLITACHPSQPISSATDQIQVSQPLPTDPMLISGVLDNGLRYYIRHNAEPKERVYLRLVVNAGSMNEDDDQRGVAHIVEHMAFNGSQDFPDNQIITALEQAGLKFGRDVNASTDYEHTIYKLNTPNNQPETLNLAFKVMTNWADKVLVEKDNLDAERGIILEEWRASLSPMQRYGDQRRAVELAHSRYLAREPIGDIPTIKNVSSKRVADFYHKWYRTDNMAIVIVGDINTREIEAQLKSQFGKLQKPNTTMESIDYSVSKPIGWRTKTLSEKGVEMSMVDFTFLTETRDDNTITRYRDEIAEQIARRIINNRLQKWEKNHPAALDGANFYISGLGKDTQKNVFLVRLTEQNYRQMTHDLMAFLAQLKQYGVTPQEVSDEVANLQSLVKQSRQSPPPQSNTLAEMLVLTAGINQPFLTPEMRNDLNEQVLKNITEKDINSVIERILSAPSRIAFNTYKNGKKPRVYNETELNKLWEKTLLSKQSQWVMAKKMDVKLPEFVQPKGSLKLLKSWDDLGVREYLLSNGSRLVYRYSQNSPNRVYFRASTAGGLRSVPQQDYQPLRIATGLVDRSGIGEFSAEDLKQIYQQTPLRLATLLDDYQNKVFLAGRIPKIWTLYFVYCM